MATVVTPPNYVLRNEPALVRGHDYLTDYLSKLRQTVMNHTTSLFYSD